MHDTHRFYSGTSGLVLPVPQALYPAEFRGKSRLTYYASLFNSLEINSSFYKTPKAATVTRWADSVPDHFRFTVKLSKAITHAKGLAFSEEDLSRFMDISRHIGNKKGCLLVQFPPGLKVEKFKEAERLLTDLKQYPEWKTAEFIMGTPLRSISAIKSSNSCGWLLMVMLLAIIIQSNSTSLAMRII